MDALVGRMRQKEHFWNAHLFNTEQGRAGALPGMNLHGTADALASVYMGRNPVSTQRR